MMKSLTKIANELSLTKLNDANISSFHEMLDYTYQSHLDDSDMGALHYIVDAIYNAGKDSVQP